MNIQKFKSFKYRLLGKTSISILFLPVVMLLATSILDSNINYVLYLLPFFLGLIFVSLNLKNYLTEAKVEDGFLHLEYYRFSEKMNKKIPLENLKMHIARTGIGDHCTLYFKEKNKTVFSQSQSSGDWNKELLFKTYDYLTAEINANKK